MFYVGMKDVGWGSLVSQSRWDGKVARSLHRPDRMMVLVVRYTGFI